MKGLILKDIYMASKYCRSYLLIVAVFTVVSVMGDNNMFFIFYPCLISSTMPINLMAYDERSKWNEYCGALPYTKGQIVAGKYIIGLMAQGAVLMLAFIAQAVGMSIRGSFSWTGYLLITLSLVSMSFISSSIGLPFMFKFGVEKGRIIQLVLIGVVCAGAVVIPMLFEKGESSGVLNVGIMSAVCIAAIAVFALSWYLSTVFYRRRESY